MRIKLLIASDRGDRKELFAVPQAARTIKEVLGSIARDLELEGEVACYTQDGFHVGNKIEAWQVLEKDMVLKLEVEASSRALAKVEVPGLEEADLEEMQVEEGATELSALAAEVEKLKEQMKVEVEVNTREQGVEIHQLPAPRSPGSEEVRGCAGCEVSGNWALWMREWGNRNRMCGTCWRATRSRRFRAR